MGIYDRDYWKDKYNKATGYKENTIYRKAINSNNRKTTAKKSNLWPGFFWIAFFILLLMVSLKTFKNNQKRTKIKQNFEHAIIIEQPVQLAPALEPKKSPPVTRELPIIKNDNKEKAWAAYYKQSDYCATVWDMDCVNEYIRVKRQFEENWR